MPRSRDILQRFRPSGTPGAASSGGVPADRVTELSVELGPVIDQLADAQAEAERIRADAVLEAEKRRQAALRRASDLVAAARREMAAERADAATQVSRRVEEEDTELLAAAASEAAAVRRRADERMPAYVDRVLTGMRAILAQPEGKSR